MFFSGEVWAVACHTEGDKTPVPEHFEAVAARLGGEINFAVLDCAAKLPEKKYNTFQRWKLDRSNKPVIFVSNGVKVQQIPAASASAPRARETIPLFLKTHTRLWRDMVGFPQARSEYDLVRELRLASIRQPAAVRNTETLRAGRVCEHTPLRIYLAENCSPPRVLKRGRDRRSRLLSPDRRVVSLFGSGSRQTLWQNSHVACCARKRTARVNARDTSRAKRVRKRRQEKCLSKPRCLLVLQGGTQLEPGAEKVTRQRPHTKKWPF